MKEAPKPYGSRQEEWYDGQPTQWHPWRLWLIGLAIGAAIVVAVAMIASKVRAQPTALLPTITQTAATSTTTPVQIIGVNPSRRSIQICTFTNAAIIAPVNPGGMTAVNPSATSGINVAVNTCFAAPSLLTASGTSGGMGAAWQAVSAAGTANISVLEY